MKHLICLALCVALCGIGANAQYTKNARTVSLAAMKRFPGFSAPQMEQLLEAKLYYPIPLPTWLPVGFKVEKVIAKVNPKLSIDDQHLTITYSKKLANGGLQTFTIRAGIEGMGSMVYERSVTVKSAFGPIDLYYEPKDYGKTVKNYAMTEWFHCDSTEYSYMSVDETISNPKSFVMISFGDTKKILGSLQKL